MTLSTPVLGSADQKIGAIFAPLSVTQQPTPGMAVKVRAGTFYNSLGEMTECAGGITPTISAPASGTKWVIVALTDSGLIVNIDGATVAPNLPTIPPGRMPIAVIQVTSSTTAILDNMIFDARPMYRSIDIVPNLANELSDRPTMSVLTPLFDGKADITGTPESTFTLNSDASGTPAANVNLMVGRGNDPSVGLRWNEATNMWEFTNDGSTWNAIPSASGTFIPVVGSATLGNIATMTSGGLVDDSGVALADLATLTDVTSQITTHESDDSLHLTSAQNILLDGISVTATHINYLGTTTSDVQVQIDSKADSSSVVNLTGDQTIDGIKTFTSPPVFDSTTNNFITLTKGVTNDAGFIVDRGGDPNASLEWDESTDQWLIGVVGNMQPVLSSGLLSNYALANGTSTGTMVIDGTIIGYKDNGTSMRVRGPQSPNEGGLDVQSYMGIFYNAAYTGTGTLETRAVLGANLEMDLELQSPHQLRLVAVDDSQADGEVYMASRTGVTINARTDAEVASPSQLIIDRVDKGTTGAANTSNVELSVTSGELEFGSIPKLPTFTVGTLPSSVAGGVIFVSDANGGNGAMAFGNGTDWIDSSTGVAVTV